MWAFRATDVDVVLSYDDKSLLVTCATVAQPTARPATQQQDGMYKVKHVGDIANYLIVILVSTPQTKKRKKCNRPKKTPKKFSFGPCCWKRNCF